MPETARGCTSETHICLCVSCNRSYWGFPIKRGIKFSFLCTTKPLSDTHAERETYSVSL